MYGWRGRIGALMPENNMVLEPEMYYVLPPGVSLHGARVSAQGETSRERIAQAPRLIPAAMEGLRGKVGVFCYACMGSSLLHPAGWHRPLEELAGGAPFLPAGETLVAALEALGARRLGVFSPYTAELAPLVPEWFTHRGFEVVHAANVPFSKEQVVTASLEGLYPILRREFTGRSVDALAVLATDLATFTRIDTLEADLGVPVVSSNLALLWCMLGALGVQESIGIGALSRLKPQARL